MKYLPIVIGAAVILLILFMQTRPASGTFVLFPGQLSDGPVTITGVDENFTLIRPVIVIDTPRRVSAVRVTINATGNGTISTMSNGRPVTLWDSTWDSYTRVATLGNVVISARNLTVPALYENMSPEDWILTYVPPGSTISDPDGLLNWGRFANTNTPTRGEQNLNYNLRGNHRLIVYANDSLTITIDKKDFNMYPGEDNMSLVLTDLVSGATMNRTIADTDGIVNVSNNRTINRTSVEFTGLEDSIYELRMNSQSNGSDFLYNATFSNGPIVIMGQVFALSPINISVLCTQTCVLRAQTWHDRSRQTITINNESVAISNRTVLYNTTVEAGTHRISVPMGNVVLSGFNQASVEGSTWTPYIYSNGANATVSVRTDNLVLMQQGSFKASTALRLVHNNSIQSIAVALS